MGGLLAGVVLSTTAACWDFAYEEKDDALAAAPIPGERESDTIVLSGTTVDAGSTSEIRDATADVSMSVVDASPESSTPASQSAPQAGCPADALRCAGHQISGVAGTLYRCVSSGSAVLVAQCANGCILSTSGGNDACNAPSKCVVGGTYCGGDMINGEPDVLYKCTDSSGASPAVVKRCTSGCKVNPGVDDTCVGG
jgi:hypothetical protein